MYYQHHHLVSYVMPPALPWRACSYWSIHSVVGSRPSTLSELIYKPAILLIDCSIHIVLKIMVILHCRFVDSLVHIKNKIVSGHPNSPRRWNGGRPSLGIRHEIRWSCFYPLSTIPWWYYSPWLRDCCPPENCSGVNIHEFLNNCRTSCWNGHCGYTTSQIHQQGFTPSQPCS